MRFKAIIHNPITLYKFALSLASLGPVAWVRLDSNDARFTIIPEQGSQVWATLAIDTVFEEYTIQSAVANNTINLEVPLQPLVRALKSAANARSVSIRLTKKDGVPWLVLTIVTTAMTNSLANAGNGQVPPRSDDHDLEQEPFREATTDVPDDMHSHALQQRRERETHITLDVPVVVLAPAQVAGLHEPHCREPDVHISLPPLSQLKSVSDRFARLAGASNSGTRPDGPTRSRGPSTKTPRLDLAATMHGTLRLSYRSDALKISSSWRGLENPELDPAQAGGEEGVQGHPSTIMRGLAPDDADDESEGWAKVRIDARDWSKVLSVGRIGGRVIACFCHGHALILYVYLPSVEAHGGEDSVLTYYVTSYAA